MEMSQTGQMDVVITNQDGTVEQFSDHARNRSDYDLHHSPWRYGVIYHELRHAARDIAFNYERYHGDTEMESSFRGL